MHVSVGVHALGLLGRACSRVLRRRHQVVLFLLGEVEGGGAVEGAGGGGAS